MAKSLYEVLEVSPSATAEEIEAASLRLGEKYRPDNNKNSLTAAIRFHQVEQAYEVLGNLEKRTEYDCSQKAGSLTPLGVFLVTLGITLIFIGALILGANGIGKALVIGFGLAMVVFGFARLRKAVSENRNNFLKRALAGVAGLFCAFFVSGIAVSIFPAPLLSTPAAKVDTKLDSAILNSCFLAGKSAATVYLANFLELAKKDILPSDVMNEGCARKGATTSNPKECIYNCELGFKATARNALK